MFSMRIIHYIIQKVKISAINENRRFWVKFAFYLCAFIVNKLYNIIEI